MHCAPLLIHFRLPRIRNHILFFWHKSHPFPSHLSNISLNYYHFRQWNVLVTSSQSSFLIHSLWSLVPYEFWHNFCSHLSFDASFWGTNRKLLRMWSILKLCHNWVPATLSIIENTSTTITWKPLSSSPDPSISRSITSSYGFLRYYSPSVKYFHFPFPPNVFLRIRNVNFFQISIHTRLRVHYPYSDPLHGYVSSFVNVGEVGLTSCMNKYSFLTYIFHFIRDSPHHK